VEADAIKTDDLIAAGLQLFPSEGFRGGLKPFSRNCNLANVTLCIQPAFNLYFGCNQIRNVKNYSEFSLLDSDGHPHEEM